MHINPFNLSGYPGTCCYFSLIYILILLITTWAHFSEHLHRRIDSANEVFSKNSCQLIRKSTLMFLECILISSTFKMQILFTCTVGRALEARTHFFFTNCLNKDILFSEILIKSRGENTGV